MHQPFDYEERWRQYVRKLGRLANAIGSNRLTPDELEERLAMLRWEQEKFMRYREQTRKRHKLDFKCQCTSCVKKYTINHDDKDFLRSIGILWNRNEGNSSTNREVRSDSVAEPGDGRGETD